MRPVRLSLQAFSSYTAKQTIDFNSLGEAGIFLIRGDMGAGKTSLFDAISFCLFGKASAGKDRPAEYLRSQLAPADMPTEVVFDFAIGDALYRIERRIEYRKKRITKRSKALEDPHGDEAYAEERSSKLYRCLEDGTGGWTESALLAEDEKKLAEKIQEILGLSHEQFSKVILLPQGKFRQFLDSDSAVREEILEALFRTRPIAQFQQRIKDKALELQRKHEALKAELGAIFQNQGVANASELSEKLAQSRAQVELQTPQVAALREEHQREFENFEKAKTASKSFEALVATERALSELEAKGAGIEALKTALHAHERANQVRPYQEESARLEKEISIIRDQLPSLEAASTNAGGKLTDAKSHLDTLENSDERQRPARLLRLQEIEALKKGLETISLREKEITQLELRMLEGEKLRAGQSAQLQDRDDKIQALTARLQGLKALAATQLQRNESVRSLERIQKFSAEAKALQARMTTQQTELDRYQNQFNQAQSLEQQALESEIQAEKEWIAGQAAHLASLIKPGDSCPVCGSREHPSLARPAPGLDPAEGTPRQRLVRAKERHKETLNSLQTARTQQELAGQRLASEHKSLEKLLNENPPLLEDRNWALELKQAQASLAEAVRANQDQEQGEIELTQLQKSRLDITEALARSRESVAIEQGKLGTLQAGLAELRQQFNPGHGADMDLHGLDEERLSLVAWIEKLDRDLAQARAELPTLIASVASFGEKQKAATARLMLLQENLQASNRSLEASLNEQGFAERGEFLRALATDAELKAKRDRISSHELSAARMNELKRVHQKAISESGFKEAPNLPESEKRKSESQERLDQSSAALVAARATRDSIQRALDSSATSLTRSAEVEELYRRMGHIASIAEGGKDNALKLSFHRYVLAVFFDEIIESANLRLRLLSDGRYGLRRPVLPGSRVGARGLDLVVEDAMTGKERPTGSLSGGEGFLASLSLALGLSDVVQSDRSGIPMEAVFIDEGFGNLDEGAVENVVLRALKDLRQSGRMVGIISHIPHLRNLIPVQLQVTKSESGSRVSVLGL